MYSCKMGNFIIVWDSGHMSIECFVSHVMNTEWDQVSFKYSYIVSNEMKCSILFRVSYFSFLLLLHVLEIIIQPCFLTFILLAVFLLLLLLLLSFPMFVASF